LGVPDPTLNICTRITMPTVLKDFSC
jgi:hypothetical protein